MPTLTRLLLILALLAAAIYAAMLGLVHWVQPESHQITVRIPQHRLQQDQNPPVQTPQGAQGTQGTHQGMAQPEEDRDAN